jgi:hypothetical protein
MPTFTGEVYVRDSDIVLYIYQKKLPTNTEVSLQKTGEFCYPVTIDMKDLKILSKETGMGIIKKS